jgi:hypothetical protein
MLEDLVYCTISPEKSKISLCTLHYISQQHEHHLIKPPGVVGLETEPPGVVGLETEPPGVVGLEGVRGMTNRSTMRTALIGSRPDAALHLLGNFLV